MRDPIRKLSWNDRLVGPACLAIEFGAKPEALSRGIAAAFLYSNPNDPASISLQQVIQTKGIRDALGEVCQIETTSQLADFIVRSYKELLDTSMVR